jgi:hypothetical protein
VLADKTAVLTIHEEEILYVPSETAGFVNSPSEFQDKPSAQKFDEICLFCGNTYGKHFGKYCPGNLKQLDGRDSIFSPSGIFEKRVQEIKEKEPQVITEVGPGRCVDLWEEEDGPKVISVKRKFGSMTNSTILQNSDRILARTIDVSSSGKPLLDNIKNIYDKYVENFRYVENFSPPTIEYPEVDAEYFGYASESSDTIKKEE